MPTCRTCGLAKDGQPNPVSPVCQGHCHPTSEEDESAADLYRRAAAKYKAVSTPLDVMSPELQILRCLRGMAEAHSLECEAKALECAHNPRSEG